MPAHYVTRVRGAVHLGHVKQIKRAGTAGRQHTLQLCGLLEGHEAISHVL